MPEPAETILYVCTTCRIQDDASETRAGARLLEALRLEAAQGAPPRVRIESVECLSVCRRPCTVAVASPDRWTYVYGDLDPETAARTILDGIGRYSDTQDGIVPWRERPDAFRKGVVARIPPLSLQKPADAT